MNLRRGAIAIAIAMSCRVLLVAADIDGKWIAEVPLREGSATQTLTLKAAGDKLSGTLEGAAGAVEISDGTISGNEVAFKVVRLVDKKRFEQTYKGTLVGNELKLSTGNGRELTFKRSQ